MNARRLGLLVFLPTVVSAGLPINNELDPMTDYTYCGVPQRSESGVIRRNAAVIAEFKRTVPCPSTGITTGACQGYSIDHKRPLRSCGCDSVTNMQWLPNELKSGPGVLPKDRWELRVYRCSPEDEAAIQEYLRTRTGAI